MTQPNHDLLRARAAHSGPQPAITVVVPVLNGGERLVDLARAILRQRVEAGPVEFLLADSGSDDGATERAAEVVGGRIFDVAPGKFDHGLVRAALVREARAPLVALFTQDSIPQGTRMLEALSAPFTSPEVAGAYARQVPRPGADPLVRATLERWTPALDDPYVIRRLPPGGENLHPGERMRLARFDNVASMVRRCIAVALPFPASNFGEDLSWGWAALKGGHGLAYVPQAVVQHSHEPALRTVYSRNVASHRQAAQEFGLQAVRGLPDGLLALLAGLPNDLRDGGPLWAVRGLPRRAAALLGQWRGARLP